MGEGNVNLTQTERAIEERDRNSSTESTGQKRRRGRPPGSNKENTQLLGLVNVAQPKTVEIEIPGDDPEPKKKAGRPKGTKKAAVKVDTTNIEVLLLTGFGILSSRPGLEDFNLTMEECKQLAEPIANIMAKNEALAQAAGEHADAFALVMAVFAIFVPKFLLWKSKQPQKPKKGEIIKYETRRPTEPQQQKGTSGSDPKSNDRQPSPSSKTAGTNFGGQLFNLVPTTAGF